MVKVKHVFDADESDDGPRLWVDLIGSTKDSQEWRRVTRVLPPQLGPPREPWEWFVEHPDEYDSFRTLYLQHNRAVVGSFDALLQELIARLM